MRWDALTLDERCYFALRNLAAVFGAQVYTQFTATVEGRAHFAGDHTSMKAASVR
jgi:hypothetical protein